MTQRLLIPFLTIILSSSALFAQVIRGPYLQRGSSTEIVVRWRTLTPSDSSVRYGPGPGLLTASANDPTITTEHEISLVNLSPATTYYYSVGSSTLPMAGNDPNHFFLTAPLSGTATPMRIWVLGDSGTHSPMQLAVRNAYYLFTGSTHTNLWMMLGDNAYPSGRDLEYQSAVFNMYPEMLRKSVLWPTLGNHDTDGETTGSSFPYYDIFTLPTNGEAGGLASGTEAYYSFDYGNVHFICLDSMTSNRSVAGAMMTWLRNDLVSTAQPWVIAFWHHPPYSKGSHDSDTESHLIEMREVANRILEDGGADLVLTGHSHSYERSYLLDGHYGPSWTFTETMKVDGGSGRPEETGAYDKPASLTPHQGTVYAVAGSSGQISGGDLNHPAMFISLNRLGSMVLDINGSRLDAKFLRETAMVDDHFTIVKGAPAAPTNLIATTVSKSAIDLAWSDNSSNEQGFRIERCTGTTCTNFVEVAVVGADVSSYSDTNLTKKLTYRYRVRAYNSNGTSDYSNIATAVTRNNP
jgi:hypothetical protein